MDETLDDLMTLSLPPKRTGGRESKYNFWDIPAGGKICRIFTDTDAHRINAAKYQFEKKHGGKFTARSMEDGSVRVWCLKTPKRPKTKSSTPLTKGPQGVKSENESQEVFFCE